MAFLRVLVLKLFAFLLLSLWSSLAKADSIPMTPFSGQQYYYSVSMDPVTVNFMWPEPGMPGSEIRTTVKVPRAYIIFASGYASRPVRLTGKYTAESELHGYETLPETIQTHRMRLLLTYPDGLPFTQWVIKHGRDAHKEEGGVRFDRVSLYSVILNYLPDSHPMPLSIYTIAHEKGVDLKDYGGLLYNPKGTLPIYYNRPGQDFFYARCHYQIEKARPGRFCTYAVTLGRNYLALVDFLDFRLHGGRAFADDRIAAFRKTMCQYFPCDH